MHIRDAQAVRLSLPRTLWYVWPWLCVKGERSLLDSLWMKKAPLKCGE